MITKTKITIGIVGAATMTLVASRLLEFSSIEWVTKMTASSGFVAIALMLGAHHTRYGRLLLAGLGLSWMGDLFLTASSDRMFLLGLGSFLLAHIAYISAFASRGVSVRWLMVAIVPVTVLSITAGVWLAPFVPADMEVPVRVYTAVISIMVITASGAGGSGASLLIPIGAVLFYFSDLAVAAGQFVQTGFPHYAWGLPFYFTAQVLLALSVRESVAGP